MANKEILKIISAVIVSSLIAGGAGSGISTYVQGQNAQKVDMRLTSLEKNKVNNEDFATVENILIIINYDVCMLRAKNNPTMQSRCEETRNERLSPSP